MTIISSGQAFVLQETVFGGYRLHVKFKDWVWDWHAGTIHFDDLFEDYYATAPASSTPISAGGVLLNWQWDGTYNVGLLVIVQAGSDAHYYIDRFPAPPPGYWSQPFSPVGATPFIQTP